MVRGADPRAARGGSQELAGELSVSSFHTTATTCAGSITVQPVLRSRRTRPSGRSSTPISFLFSPLEKPIWPTLLTSMETDPGLPMRGRSRSQIVSPVTRHHLPQVRSLHDAARGAVWTCRPAGHRTCFPGRKPTRTATGLAWPALTAAPR